MEVQKCNEKIEHDKLRTQQPPFEIRVLIKQVGQTAL